MNEENPLFNLLGVQAVVNPDRADDRDVDRWEDVRWHPQQHKRRQQQQQQRCHHKRIRSPQR
jgi:hypothetical protein